MDSLKVTREIPKRKKRHKQIENGDTLLHRKPNSVEAGVKKNWPSDGNRKD